MLSLLSYVHLVSRYTEEKELKRLPTPLIIYLKHEKEFVVTVVSGMHSEGTVLSGSEGTNDKGTEATKGNGKWVGGGAQLRRSR